MTVGVGGKNLEVVKGTRSEDGLSENYHIEGRIAGGTTTGYSERKKRRRETDAVDEGGPSKKPPGNPPVLRASGTTDIPKATREERMIPGVKDLETVIEGLAKGSNAQTS
ncbi:hypothetical protein N7G274_003241 [Stereocaulon virgatum]|uniref:Uncharacterized protein n=1 Tax=Stereocaulon virgatum TaxID=373712 RepID=A0ABR4AD18_9LECA